VCFVYKLTVSNGAQSRKEVIVPDPVVEDVERINSSLALVIQVVCVNKPNYNKFLVASRVNTMMYL